MLATEEEAKMKWCPETASSRCLASGCMAWIPLCDSLTEGYCGRAGFLQSDIGSFIDAINSIP